MSDSQAQPNTAWLDSPLVDRLRNPNFAKSPTFAQSYMLEAADEIASLRAALVRQCDNMAFIINHAELGHWYERFSSELAEDRKALARGRQEP